MSVQVVPLLLCCHLYLILPVASFNWALDVNVAVALAHIVWLCGCVVMLIVSAGVIELGQSSTNTPEDPVPLISSTINLVKGVLEFTRTATSVTIWGCEVTTPLFKVAAGLPFPFAQSYTMEKVGVPLLVVSLTLSFTVEGLPITINHISALVIGLLKV